ncbi:hypothetical protein GYMLUDRAFT_243108 [Collybiopsis luxurians FD-317 M1]|uniref:Uncharacterized protein n=1 Tax=Collybiopsis luxurians FD-317 M1 TaxID=944289 RepID=A0A0D0BDX9_9AGAR|nr:hypothetical protein GYMLUDRAFT_243108 [Collybiopsis luxurians FD-317 M1]
MTYLLDRPGILSWLALPLPNFVVFDAPQTRFQSVGDLSDHDPNYILLAHSDQPLFHPRKCSGTIWYIHQDCSTTSLALTSKNNRLLLPVFQRHPNHYFYPFRYGLPIRRPALPSILLYPDLAHPSAALPPLPTTLLSILEAGLRSPPPDRAPEDLSSLKTEGHRSKTIALRDQFLERMENNDDTENLAGHEADEGPSNPSLILPQGGNMDEVLKRRREPLSNVPMGLLLLDPGATYTMAYFRLRRALQGIAIVVWKRFGRHLRLTSY